MKGLEVTGLRKRLGSLEIQAGFAIGPDERVGIAAPSGFGKTTLLRILAGLSRPDAGAILLGGRDITRIAPEARGSPSVTSKGVGIPVIIFFRTRSVRRPMTESHGPHMPRSVW